MKGSLISKEASIKASIIRSAVWIIYLKFFDILTFHFTINRPSNFLHINDLAHSEFLIYINDNQ